MILSVPSVIDILPCGISITPSEVSEGDFPKLAEVFHVLFYFGDMSFVSCKDPCSLNRMCESLVPVFFKSLHFVRNPLLWLVIVVRSLTKNLSGTRHLEDFKI